MRTLTIFFVLAVATSLCDAQWVQTSLDNVHVTCLAFNGTNLFAGSSIGFGVVPGVFLSTNNGTNWTEVDSGLTSSGANVLATRATNLFAGTYEGVYISTNNGTSWTQAGLTNASVRSFAISDTNLFAGTSGVGVYLSTNNGTSWTAAGLPGRDVEALAVSGTNLFAGTYGGGVFLTTNNGTSWSAVNSGLTDTNVIALATCGTNLFAATSGGVSGLFLSTNNGASWTALDSGLVHIRALAVSGTNLFAGTGYCTPRSCHDSLFVSTNNGTSWTEVGSGLTHHSYIMALVVFGTNLFAGLISQPFTGGGPIGVWRRPLSEMTTSVSPAAPLPTEFCLSQNYPNPFNPSTTIEYSLPRRASVEIKVLDVLGREVATLLNEEKPAGAYRVRWDAEGVASGVYFYRIQAGSFVDVKKLILLR